MTCRYVVSLMILGLYPPEPPITVQSPITCVKWIRLPREACPSDSYAQPSFKSSNVPCIQTSGSFHYVCVIVTIKHFLKGSYRLKGRVTQEPRKLIDRRSIVSRVREACIFSPIIACPVWSHELSKAGSQLGRCDVDTHWDSLNVFASTGYQEDRQSASFHAPPAASSGSPIELA